LKYGYGKKLAAGATAAGALLAVMIPPSVVLVIYGGITLESVGKLLIAGILPGILTVIVYSIGIAIWVKSDPKIAPPGPSFTFGEKIKSIKDVWGIALLALIIIGGIYSGFFTPSEAAAVGGFAALLLALSTGRKAFPAIRGAFEETARTTSMIFLLLIGSTFFSFFLTLSGGAAWISQTVAGLPVSRMVILGAIVLLYVGLGMIIDTISMQLITVPIMYPIILNLGFDGIWFGVLVTQLVELGMITPPVGINLYVLKGVAPPEVSLEDVLVGVVPFIVMQIIVIVILIAFPQIALILPSMMG
jgi:tripartite ATP-independent transporter DctM subunit